MQRMRSLRCLPSYRARHRSTSFLGTDSRDSTKGALYQRKTIRKLDTAESCAKKIKMMLATLIPLPGRFASMLCIWPSLPSPYALIILAHLGCRRVLNLKTSSKQKKKKTLHTMAKTYNSQRSVAMTRELADPVAYCLAPTPESRRKWLRPF